MILLYFSRAHGFVEGSLLKQGDLILGEKLSFGLLKILVIPSSLEVVFLHPPDHLFLVYCESLVLHHVVGKLEPMLLRSELLHCLRAAVAGLEVQIAAGQLATFPVIFTLTDCVLVIEDVNLVVSILVKVIF